MNTTIIPSNDGRLCIELMHRIDDPANWVVRTSKKFLWFRFGSSSAHFLSEQQARAYAHTMAGEI